MGQAFIRSSHKIKVPIGDVRKRLPKNNPDNPVPLNKTTGITIMILDIKWHLNRVMRTIKTICIIVPLFFSLETKGDSLFSHNFDNKINCNKDLTDSPHSNNFNVTRSVKLKNGVSFYSQIDKNNQGKDFVKYIVNYDFDLCGAVVQIPKGCVLEIKKGSLSNGTIVGDKTCIINCSNGIKSSIICKGTFVESDNIYKVENYGIHPDGSAILSKLQWLSRMVYEQGGGVIQFSSGIYIMGSNTTSSNSALKLCPNVVYCGNNEIRNNKKTQTIIKANNTATPFYSMFFTGDDKTKNVTFKNIIFDTYIGKKNGAYQNSDLRDAILLAKANDVLIQGCKFICDIGSINARSSHLQEDKDRGIYGVYNLTIQNCEFECHLLNNSGYLDITIMPIVGQNVIIQGNRYRIYNEIMSNGTYYPNCAIDVQGRDVYILDNEIRDFSNAIDIDCADKYNDYRNIIIENNKIFTCRGVGIWGRDSANVQGISIKNNRFVLSKESPNRWPNARNAIGFVSHVVVSKNAFYKDIIIDNNEFRVGNNFYDKLNVEKWRHDNKPALNIGYTYEEYYSAIDAGGISASRENIIISNNKFFDLFLPAIYIGGRNCSNNYTIRNNLFYNCSAKTNMIYLMDCYSNISITGNVWECEKTLNDSIRVTKNLMVNSSRQERTSVNDYNNQSTNNLNVKENRIIVGKKMLAF